MRYLSILVLSAVLASTSSVGQSAEESADLVWLRITSERVAIASTESDAEQMRDEGTRGGGMVVGCRKFELAHHAKYLEVQCHDGVFITAAGVEGRAAIIRYDGEKKLVSLSGTDEAPVRLWFESAGQAATEMQAHQVTFPIDAAVKAANQVGTGYQAAPLIPATPKDPGR